MRRETEGRESEGREELTERPESEGMGGRETEGGVGRCRYYEKTAYHHHLTPLPPK